MKPVGRRMTVDFYNPTDTVPAVGMVVVERRHDGALKGYSRVLSVRPVKVKVSRGERARYALRVERIPTPPEIAAVDSVSYGGATWFTVTDYPPKPKRDRWSPLL